MLILQNSEITHFNHVFLVLFKKGTEISNRKLIKNLKNLLPYV